MDIITFDFACHYYKGRYATGMGRCYDSTRVENSRDSISEAVWILLDIGTHNPCSTSNMDAVALATSNHYAPPPILEDIAENASTSLEHKQRDSIDVDEGRKYGRKGVGY